MNKIGLFVLLSLVVLLLTLTSCKTTGSNVPNPDGKIDLKTLIDHTQLNVQKSDMKNVQLSILGMPIPMTTAMKSNSYQPVSIKSLDGKKFVVLDCRIAMSKEAITKDNIVLQEFVTYYKLKPQALISINKLAAKGEIVFSQYFDKLSTNDMYFIEDGNSKEPNKNDFSKLRSREVYSFKIQDSTGEVFPIQLYIEIETDVKDL